MNPSTAVNNYWTAQLVRCHVRACELGPMILEDCLIDTVLVAARRSPRFEIDKAAVDRLCPEGMAFR